MFHNLASNRLKVVLTPRLIISLCFCILFISGIFLLDTIPAQANREQGFLSQVSEIIVVPRNYVFTWGSSGQNIDANNTVYCSSNSDFWQVLYWRTSDTDSNAGVNDWNPSITTGGNYDIYVYIPDYTHSAPITTQARYYFNGSLIATLDQNQNKCQWVWIGRQWFDVGTGSTISMPAQTSDNPYRLIAGDGLKLVYVQPYYSISGYVIDTGGNPIPGVTLNLNTGATTTSAANGSYQFANLLPGVYTITPNLSGYNFSPVSSTVNLNSNLTNINFTVTNRYYISGRTLDTNGNAVPNATVNLYGLTTQMTTTSAANGRYTFSNLVAGLYRVEPDRSTYPFSPIVRGWMFVPPNATDQDFTTTPIYGTVTGQVTAAGTSNAVSDARVSIGGKTTQTDGSGNYTLTGILPGVHAIYVTATGYQDYQGSVSVQPNLTGTHNAAITYILPTGYRLPFPAGQTRLLYNDDHDTGYAQDWSMPVGSEVVASRDGKVLFVVEDSNSHSYPNYIALKHDDGNLTWYVHLKQNGALVNVGDYVKSGQVIGLSGNTGTSSGPHLHFAFTKNAQGWPRMIPYLLDVPGGVPIESKWYTSGNVMVNGVDGMDEIKVTQDDLVAPVGSIRFRMGGESVSTVILNAFDYGSDNLQVRLATNETALQSATWQSFENQVNWPSPVVYGQFRDDVGNISPVYSDVVEATTYETLTPIFSVKQQVCVGESVIIPNESTPLCEQCGWRWTMGNGDNFTSLDPLQTDPGDGFHYSDAGLYTITLQAANAKATTNESHEVTVLESPTGAFTIRRLNETIWVVASDTNVSGYAWEFGDGVTAIGRSATHTYANVETLEVSLVKLTVTAQNGCSTTTYQPTPVEFHVYVPLILR